VAIAGFATPDDGADRAALMRAVDRDLHAGKDARRGAV
jgi:hypothetical protein